MTAELFNVAPYTDMTTAERWEASYTVRLTERRKASFARGVHPTTQRPLNDTGAHCGSCVHHLVARRSRDYHKCAKSHGGLTGGPASDIRVGWQACDLWEPDTIECA